MAWGRRSVREARQREAELAAELEEHIQQRAAQYEAQGLNPAEALRRARIRFGSVPTIQEEIRALGPWEFLAGWVRDLRFALRSLRRDRLFSVSVAATLAIGIGANAAVFSVINTVLLRPLPFEDDNRLAVVWESNSEFGLKNSAPAFGNYIDWSTQSRSFTSIGALDRRMFQLTGGDEAEEVAGGVVTPNLFSTIGVKPIHGRAFQEREEKAGAERVAIIGYDLWQRRYSGRNDALYAPITLNGERYSIVGVMPDGFRFPNRDMEVWVPTGAVYGVAEWSNRDRHNLFVVGRLKGDRSMAQAYEDIQSIMIGLQREYPKTNANVTAAIQPLREYFVGDVRKLYAILLAAAGLILLITCSNLANLMLVRAGQRAKEAAISIALGASRRRVIGRYLAESWVLSACGGTAGLLIAALGNGVLKYLLPADLAGLPTFVLDYRLLSFTLAVSIASGTLFGLIPAIQATRLELVPALKEASGNQVGSTRRTQLIRSALVVLQVALSLVLLVGSTLLLRTFVQLRSVQLGFDSSNVLTLRVRLPKALYSDKSRQRAFTETTLERIENLPGVIAAGFTTGVPLALKGSQTGIRLEDKPDGSIPVVNNRSITTNYLRTMGMQLVSGRNIEGSDYQNSQRVALINESMARKLWPAQNPLGQRFQIGMQSVWISVVGVVVDVKQAGLDVDSKPEMYLPFAQQPTGSFAVVVRTQNSPLLLAAAVRQVFRDANPDVPTTQGETMEGIVDKELFNRRVQTILVSAFAVIAGLVALVGIYGLIAYTVQQRTREIALRLALGATPTYVLARVVLGGLTITVVGVAIGLAAASAVTEYIRSFLFGVGPRDPLTFIVVSATLLGVAAAAVIIPALRAASITPAEALRHE